MLRHCAAKPLAPDDRHGTINLGQWAGVGPIRQAYFASPPVVEKHNMMLGMLRNFMSDWKQAIVLRLPFSQHLSPEELEGERGEDDAHQRSHDL